MKITIDKNITIGDVTKAKKIITDFNGTDYADTFSKDEMKRAGKFYAGSNNVNIKVYDVTAQIMYNSHCDGCSLQSDDDAFNSKYPLDIWVEMFVRGDETCAEIGFYLTDFWQLSGDNGDEIRNRAFINAFKHIK